ncbi:hypothetical protein SUGI_0881930 [Cryptomeria japonica]|uniref:serine carboxypeptidase-like 45 n=1 Tax=Cryptomeria japonica TaxID=3369 RepID=UPI00241476E0|nr:serine carboxypeptidase-like 45 [Cryptomeria japonica]GLJ42537.1 hypothetical protein SUGI_0881930 [Cryptomeria japonica]
MDFLKVVECGIIFSLLMVHSVITAPEYDLIKKLPGQREKVSFKQYGGYITTDEEHGRALYYYFVEAQTNATSRPLALWLNGGPGCSSLGFGAFEENGPFKFNGKVLEQNKFSWNIVTNMLYVESPIGVGFSYSNTTSDYHLFNDTLTAQDNLAFLLNWFKKFSEYRDVDFYITGESYGGHYIPQMASLVLDYNKKSGITPINLKGIIIGNPYVDIEISINNGEFQWSHGLISDETYQLTQTICNNSKSWIEMFVDQNTSESCNNVFDKVHEEIGNIDYYDVTLGICLDESSSSSQLSKLQGGVRSKFIQKNLKGVNAINLCSGNDIFTYLNTNKVQKDIHASISNDTYSWSFCDGPLNYDERNRGINIIPLLSKLLNYGLPIMLFSGDQDSVVPFTATRTIANTIAKQLQLFPINTYGTWYDNQQVAGWTQSYGHVVGGKNQTILTFASVRGGAHEVPYTSPSEALTLFKAFIGGLPLPTS